MKKRRLLSILLTLALMLGLLPGMSLTAYAYEGNPYASLVNTTTAVKFNNINWYIIKDESTAIKNGTVTLLTKDPIASSQFHSSSNAYSGSTVKTLLDNMTTGSFAGVADAIATTNLTDVGVQNARLWLLSLSEANALSADVRKCSKRSELSNYYWCFRTAGTDGSDKVAYANGSFGWTDDRGSSVNRDFNIRPLEGNNPEGNTPGTWAWANSTQSVGDVVTPAATFKAIFTPDSSNYKTVENVNVSVTVSAADPTTPTNLTATYGQTLADVTLPDGWAWKDSTTSVGEVGTNSFKADYTATSTNYNSKTDVDVTVTVGKANAVAATVTANSRTYDGTEKPLVTVTGEATGGTMQYALGENATTAPAENLYTTSIMRKAVRWQLIPFNPCERVDPPKVKKAQIECLDVDEAVRLVELLGNAPIYYRTAIIVLLFTGMRRGELLGLEWRDIDFSKSLISISRSQLYLPERGLFEDETKNESSERILKVSKTVLQALMELHRWQMEQSFLMADAWMGSNKVFTGAEGDDMRPDTLTNWFRDFIDTTDLPPIHLHSLRHTNATLAIANGVAITTVAGQLGHVDANTTTKIYAHAIQSAQAEAADRMEDILSGRRRKDADTQETMSQKAAPAKKRGRPKKAK